MKICRALIIVCRIACACTAAAAAPKTFTLEQVLSAPFPAGLVASPNGGRFAWVFNASGARNVCVAEAPEYRGRAVTSYTADDGEEIGSLAFTVDGKSIVYVRGEEANRQGEVPNPLSRECDRRHPV